LVFYAIFRTIHRSLIMTNPKIGDKVIISNSTSAFFGEVGVIMAIDEALQWAKLKLDNGSPANMRFISLSLLADQTRKDKSLEQRIENLERELAKIKGV
jgi:hypothetical protein